MSVITDRNVFTGVCLSTIGLMATHSLLCLVTAWSVCILLECFLVLFIVIRIMDRMGLPSVVSIIHTLSISTMLNSKGGNNGLELKTLHFVEQINILYLRIRTVTHSGLNVSSLIKSRTEQETTVVMERITLKRHRKYGCNNPSSNSTLREMYGSFHIK